MGGQRRGCWLPWCFVTAALLEQPGKACVDSPTRMDADGYGCNWYKENPSDCGHFDTWWFAASEECCVSCHTSSVCNDTTAERDSGGDNCSFYDERPEFCGCCDTPTFKAGRDCCACGQIPEGTAAWWTEVFHAWPRKAVSLHLGGKGIQGTLPPTLGLLVNLKSLRLSRHQLSGALPPELGNLSTVEHMDLRSNQLNGSLPAELGNLSQLEYLDLADNQFSGSLPAELGKLSQLRTISLDANQLSGSLPAELGNLSQLQNLWLSLNHLSGSLPAELGNLSHLRKISLERNQLSGSLPAELGKLSQLQTLSLGSNQLSGSLPAELGKLSQLRTLSLSSNQLSGSLPAELGNLSRMQFLNLGGNQLNGSLPAELGKLSQLVDLILSGNQLSGSLPTELGKLQQLQFLRLQSNQLSGSLPAELGRLSQLSQLMLENNQLSGSLPAELGHLPQLMYLDLSNNHLSGSLPAEFGNLSQIIIFWLRDNELSGSLPAELGELSTLWDLDIGYNQLSGSLPSELGKLSQLLRLRLHNNQLSGSLPAELGNISQLGHLYLDNNKLSGSLPAELGKLSQLVELRLDGNQLSGSLPEELGKLVQLWHLSLNDNQLSGSLPAELGKLSQLRELHLNNNQLSGSLPAELGKLVQLQFLYLQDNQLSSSLPAELGKLSQLRKLLLDNNLLEGGIPTSYVSMSLLEVLSVNHNPQFCGSTEAITELQQLRTLSLRGCCFRTIARPPAGLEVLNLGYNQLTTVPESFWNLKNLTTLLLDHNTIGQWDTSSARPLSWHLSPVCGMGTPSTPPRNWTKLVLLDVSGNSFGPLVHDFLATLVHLPALKVLLAAGNRLSGGMPDIFGGAFMTNHKRERGSYWEGDCQLGFLEPVFPALQTLDLSRNRITHMLSPPPELLLEVNLTGNQLNATGLAASWWQSSTLQRIDVRRNSALRLPVRLYPGSSCEQSGPDELAANPQGWDITAAAGSKCTALCPRQPRVIMDNGVQEEVLCRCSAGHGTGLNCLNCAENSYSVQSFRFDYDGSGHGHYKRTCHSCPEHSELVGSAGQCFADCVCHEAYFMQMIAEDGNASDLGPVTCSFLLTEAQLKGQRGVDMEGTCRSCGIWRTSEAGSRTEADCLCNANQSRGGWSRLLQQGSVCRCPDGEVIDFAQRSCVPCSIAEICTDWTKSLEPPPVKPGFWALPPPPKGSDGLYGNFSRHDIWRCDSHEACPGDYSCGVNRTGTACSICRQGFFRTAGGSCIRCPRSYSDTRYFLLGLLLASTVLPLLIHGLLTVVDDSFRGQVMALRAFRVSLKQVLKFAQVLGVVSLFQVEWPALVLSVFEIFRALTFDLLSWMGVACLDSQQQETAALTFAVRWMTPILVATVTAVSAVAARSCGLLCLRRRATRVGRLLNFRFLDVLRVLLFLLQLFYPSVLKNAVLPLTCSPSPNGHFTLNMYPDIICDLKGGSFWPLALVGGVYTVLLVAAYPLLLFHLKRRLEALAEGEDEEKVASANWWTFIFDDFRPDARHFVLLVVAKDILLNLIPAVLPGLGTFQLLITAVVSSGYAFWVVHIGMPFYDASNTVLEACTSAAVAILCVFSAGMGFQSEPEVLDIAAYLKDGRKSSVYIQRALTLVILQTLSLFAPAAIITFQVLAVFRCTRRLLPRSLVPASAEQLQAWRRDNYAALGQLDDVATANLHRWVQSSAAARRYLRQSSSSLQKIEPEATDVEQPGEEEPLQPSQPSHGPQGTDATPSQPMQEPLQPNPEELPATEPSPPTHEPPTAVLGRVSL